MTKFLKERWLCNGLIRNGRDNVRNIISSGDAEQFEESRLKSTFCLNILETGIEVCLVHGVFSGGFGVNEVASLAVHAGAFA